MVEVSRDFFLLGGKECGSDVPLSCRQWSVLRRKT